MKRNLRALAAAGSLSLALFAADAAFAQKSGGILKLGHFDSRASTSMLEESTQAVAAKAAATGPASRCNARKRHECSVYQP